MQKDPIRAERFAGKFFPAGGSGPDTATIEGSPVFGGTSDKEDSDMDKAQLDEFKQHLLRLKAQIMNSGVMNSKEDLEVSPEDLSDETDLATSVVTQQVSFNIRQRELSKIRGIEDALWRIENGSFGQCEECNESIGKKRMMLQPWTTLCITHAEEQEREQQKFSRGA
jgi:DnaK suppressor protein